MKRVSVAFAILFVWNTIFSRFANEDREEVGDIDLDISPDQRELVYNHIIESFGYDKTAYILAIGTVSDKGTIDEIGRALDIPLDEVAHIKEMYSACGYCNWWENVYDKSSCWVCCCTVSNERWR